jgi:TatD DNase family protein
MLVDSHCHLDFPDFQGDFSGVLGRAAEAGVGLLLTIGTSLAKFDKVLAVAEAHDHVYCTVGIHPHEAGQEPGVTAERLVALAAHPKVVGFGETGLDYFYEHSPRDQQQASFRAHIAAARQTGLPLVVHTRDADADTGAILAEEFAKGAFSGLIHCFSSGPELAEKAMQIGFYISISGIITFAKADVLRDTVRGLPLDRLLVETDAPYLAPVPKRGKRNEPAFVAHTAAKLAELTGRRVGEVEAATTANFLRLFKKIAPPCGATP